MTWAIDEYTNTCTTTEMIMVQINRWRNTRVYIMYSFRSSIGPMTRKASFAAGNQSWTGCMFAATKASASLHRHSVSAKNIMAAMFKAGSIYVNVWGPSDPAAPFGGYKASGIGREMGHANLDAYLEVKTVWTGLG